MASTQCISRAILARASSVHPTSRSVSRGLKPAVHQPRRGDLVVRHADEGMTEDKDPFDMSAIGLDDIMQLTDDAEMSSRAAWLPGSYAPSYLDGKLPGDFGFDPLGFGADPAALAQFREAEVIHGRWAMLGVLGCLSVEVLGFGTWLDAPTWAVTGGEATWFGQTVPFDLTTLAAVELASMAFVEGKRAGADAEARVYPGGAFDPLGFSKDAAKLEELKLKEIKNGRLAMVAIFGFFMQASVTKAGPVANWVAHISDPWNVNVATSNDVSIPFLHPEVLTNGAAYWQAALPAWYPGV